MKNMEQELIRKAAEAMHETCRQQAWLGELLHPFNEQPIHAQHVYEEFSKAALTIFYEHTRAQPRERKPLICPDCNGTMKPTLTNPNIMVCSDCGTSQ